MIRPLSKELQEKAIEKLNEVPDRIPSDIQYIKEWILKQPHLKCRMDDQWILTFLRGCKFSLERTKEKIDTYYTMRLAVPELFANRNPMDPIIQEVLKTGTIIPLKNSSDPTAPVVFLSRGGIYDPAKLDISDVFRLNYIVNDIMLIESDRMTINGIRVLLDLEMSSIGHFMQFTPSFIKKSMTTFQEGYPIRPQGIHFINTPPGFETIFNIFLSFSKEKLKQRLYVHNKDFESLYKYIPKEILPEEYGGNAGPFEKLREEMQAKVESYADWFEEDKNYCTNEKLRPGKPKTSEDLFGLEGSFRQLNVD